MVLNDLIKLNNLALEFFLYSFKQSKEAKNYVYSRISKRTAKLFKIGYAPFAGMWGYISNHDASLIPIAKEIGLIGIYNNKIAQQFSNRIIIPIFHAGIVVGFGARALNPKTKAKYKNSRNSMLYNKGEILYGLQQNRINIQEKGYAYLVEGYFDVLGLANNGIRNVVASCGTSFTSEQAIFLKRYTDKVYVLFDGDQAGISAAKKAKQVLKKNKLYGGRILLPEGHDPDTFIQKYSKKELEKLEVKY